MNSNPSAATQAQLCRSIVESAQDAVTARQLEAAARREKAGEPG